MSGMRMEAGRLMPSAGWSTVLDTVRTTSVNARPRTISICGRGGWGSGACGAEHGTGHGQADLCKRLLPHRLYLRGGWGRG